jgi:two-component system, OmpR family, sensor histidine kinase BaeS
MKLRLRIVFSLAVVSVPLVAGLTWARGELDYRDEVDALHRLIVARMEDGRAACEEDPVRFPVPLRRGQAGPRDRPPRPGERFGPEGRLGAGEPGPEGPPETEPPPDPRDRENVPPELFAYYPNFASANPRATRFPDPLRAKLEAGAERAEMRFQIGDRSGIRVAARMPWGEGPAAVILMTRWGSGPLWLTKNQLITAIALALGLAMAAFVSAGPVVRRVRRLTKEIRGSVAERYMTPVTVTGSDEIAELARGFNFAQSTVQKQLRTVEEREEALRSFVANTTHDVMIPMTVLQGHLSSMTDPDRPADLTAIKGAIDEVQYMTSLLQNLAVTATLEAGEDRFVVSAVNLNALVERVVARHLPVAKQKQIEINHAVPEQPVMVQGDVTLLEQAVSNLVHNAVRYGDAGGHVAIVLRGAADADWSLRVIDDGPGIPEAQLAAVTQRSFRSDEARSRHPDGQGLGLHIALEVARRHGFRLEFRRSEFGGLEAELHGA